MRLRTTDQPLEFVPTRPLFQIQPVLRYLYRPETLADLELQQAIDKLAMSDWREFAAALNLRNSPGARVGSSKAESRRRDRAANAPVTKAAVSPP